MRSRLPPALVITFAVLVSAGAAQAQEPGLKPGYVACKTGGQLLFFVSPSASDLYGEGAPDSVRIYPDGHPGKEADMMVNGRLQTVTKGRKALSAGDCRKTAGMKVEGVEVLEVCTEILPLPNGGCRRIRASGSEWYVFGNTLAPSSM